MLEINNFELLVDEVQSGWHYVVVVVLHFFAHTLSVC